MKKWTSLVLVVGLFSQVANASVFEGRLENGMKVLVKTDHRAPVVVSQVWYKVGSSYEPQGITGISHMLEHMMFKGTDKLKPGEFSRIIARLGGSENAFTGKDYTAYFQTLEKSKLAQALELEADRMRFLKLDEAEFKPEQQVVAEERRMRVEDKPSSKFFEQFLSKAYPSGPYHHPVIGWMQDIQAYQLADLQAWYQQWYAPNNATLVVAGDVEPKAVMQLAAQYFGALKPSPIPDAPVQKVGDARPQLKDFAHKDNTDSPTLLIGYPVPSLNTASNPREAYALEVLAEILDGGDSARLPSRLVREQAVASSAGAGYSLYDRLSSLFFFEVSPSQGQDLVAAQNALEAEINRVKTQPVTAAELARVKAQIEAAKVYEKDSLFYQAMQLGQLETVGLGWQSYQAYVDQVLSVTPEEILAVANKYLQPEARIQGRLLPKGDAS
jgi:zinc protease